MLLAKYTKKGILRTRVLWMKALSINHLEGVKKSGVFSVLTTPPVQQSSLPRVVYKGGKQDLIRSAQENST